MSENSTRKIYPYEEGIMERVELTGFRTYEYQFPFNYQNIEINRIYNMGETHGMESNPINSVKPNPINLASDYIAINEDHPIIRVVVIGSACTPPGYVQIECEPIDGFRRDDEVPGVMPVRFRQNNLWGMHVRGDQWLTRTPGLRSIANNSEYDEIPEELIRKSTCDMKGMHMKSDYREFPLAGMSCAIFEVPMSKKVYIAAGCEIPGWKDDNYPDDAHYSMRMVRITVAEGMTK